MSGWLTVTSPGGPFHARAAAVLTNSLVYTEAIDISNQNQVTALVDFTKGSLTDMQMRVQLSWDKTNWYDYEIDDTQNEVISGTDCQIPARAFVRVLDGDCHLAINIPVKSAWVRFGVIGVGTVTSSSCAISTMLGKA